MSARNPAWWASLHFYEGVLEELAQDSPSLIGLSNGDRKTLLESIRTSRQHLQTIESELTEEPPF